MTEAMLGIVGGGQFGRFMAGHLARVTGVCIFEPDPAAQAALQVGGLRLAPLDVCAACPVVVVAVPYENLQAVLTTLVPHLQPGTVVVDVCSVKAGPHRLLSEALPEGIDYVCTHPLFGPQSGRAGLHGLELIVCPGRGRAARQRVCWLARRLGLRVIRMSAEEHDRQMAYVQALTHLLGRTLVNMVLPETRVQTRSYRHLLELRALLRFDSAALFRTIQLANPQAAAVRTLFADEMQRTLALLED